ncbi:hypothetical protein A3A01_00430 [Candidatus Nomurabacteria bacterium RIFCSPLOWO2_01_FULL_39_17]|uniref:Uncharacterized protein n=1 Tax=Candidatus Nomurabacteria bacterium RIFCSPLOWO2_01_FULL_39_17 TaxID=1801770 RepID=A0A1F6WVC4_9BACT|nr:MAG: hypothetical protein A3A01_00430 [Candidatus Nomurabacteria bacterium RIFCSPLOWO2_01_FULL_39_17]
MISCFATSTSKKYVFVSSFLRKEALLFWGFERDGVKTSGFFKLQKIRTKKAKFLFLLFG